MACTSASSETVRLTHRSYFRAHGFHRRMKSQQLWHPANLKRNSPSPKIKINGLENPKWIGPQYRDLNKFRSSLQRHCRRRSLLSLPCQRPRRMIFTSLRGFTSQLPTHVVRLVTWFTFQWNLHLLKWRMGAKMLSLPEEPDRFVVCISSDEIKPRTVAVYLFEYARKLS